MKPCSMTGQPCRFTAVKRIDGVVVSTHCTWCWRRKPFIEYQRSAVEAVPHV